MNKNNLEKELIFSGPLFVVGMPRSGTKLLRDLLNNHSDIFIPPNESKIIPFLTEQFGLSISKSDLPKVLDEWYSSVFYSRISEAGYTVNRNKVEKSVDCSGDVPLSHILESFYKNLTHQQGGNIWGDKTPTYLKHYSLLMEMYPDARFIHIVRDVRDYCLSINKAWGKHMVRAAFRWDQSLKSFISQIDRENVLHITYEDLITNPDTVLNRVCSFLEVDYSEDMIQLQKPAENLGDAKGMTSIKKDNRMKWPEQLSEKQIRKIEKTSADMMRHFGYKLNDYAGDSEIPSLVSLYMFKVVDGINLLKFHAKRLNGISSAIAFISREYKRKV